MGAALSKAWGKAGISSWILPGWGDGRSSAVLLQAFLHTKPNFCWLTGREKKIQSKFWFGSCTKRKWQHLNKGHNSFLLQQCCCSAEFLIYDKIMECFGLERTLKLTFLQPSAMDTCNQTKLLPWFINSCVGRCLKHCKSLLINGLPPVSIFNWFPSSFCFKLFFQELRVIWCYKACITANDRMMDKCYLLL